MAIAARSGFAHVGADTQVFRAVIAQADTNPYAIGDPVRTSGALRNGQLPSGIYTQGLLIVERAVSGRPVRGVIIGVEKDDETAGNTVVPAEKLRDYVVYVRSADNATFTIQCANASALAALGPGTRACFHPGPPNGTVSGFYAEVPAFGGRGDLSVVNIVSNTGSNSTIAVTFTNTETRPTAKDWVDVTPPVTLTSCDSWALWRMTEAGTVTIPAGLEAPPTLAIIPPPSGDLTIEVSGGATANGATDAITRDRATNPGGIGIVSYGGDAYGVSGC